MPKKAAWARLTMPVTPTNRSRLRATRARIMMWVSCCRWKDTVDPKPQAIAFAVAVAVADRPWTCHSDPTCRRSGKRPSLSLHHAALLLALRNQCGYYTFRNKGLWHHAIKEVASPHRLTDSGWSGQLSWHGRRGHQLRSSYDLMCLCLKIKAW